MSVQTKKTMDNLTMKQQFDLISKLESSIDVDLEHIFNFFNDVFGSEIARNNIRRFFNSTSKSASRALVETLMEYRVEISRLYACFLENGMRDACSLIEKEFPEIINATRASPMTNNLLDITNIHKMSPLNVSSSTTTTGIDENSVVDMIQSGSSISAPITSGGAVVSPQSSSYQLYTSHHPIAVLELIGRYEEVFPVICEDCTTGGEFNNPAVSFKRVGSPSFDVVPIKERKLTFRRREFHDESEYVNELKMIKHKHLNLITAECIYKNLSNKAYYYLLYNHDANYQSVQLDEFSAETRRQLDSQFNTLHQLSILRDVSAALAYLYETNTFKKHLTIHGNLQPSNVMIFYRDIKQTILSAKVFDFTKSTNITEPENFAYTFRDEFYRFGLIVYTTLKFRPIDRQTCENLHRRLTGIDEDSNINAFRHDLEINKQIADPTRDDLFEAKTFMLTLFYKITRPGFEPKRDSMKNYQKYLAQLMDKLEAEIRKRQAQLTPKSNTNNANKK